MLVCNGLKSVGTRSDVDRRVSGGPRLDNETSAATGKQAVKSSITGVGAKLYDEVIE